LPDSKPNWAKWWEFRSALMTIIAFHVRKLSGGELLATAFARALDMTSYEQRLTRHNHDGPGVWPLVLEKLNTMVAACAAGARSRRTVL
jgi:hypothetical protein